VLHRLDLLARLSEARRHLRALGAAAAELRGRLAERWPEAASLADFPAFLSRAP
jgi:hypothetical protein